MENRHDQYEYFKFFNIAIHEYKCIYFFIPKVACTSLKKAVAEILGLNVRTEYHFYHYPFVTDWTLFDDYFKFCFVRNPWDRLVSCYFNKLQTGFPPFKRFGFSQNMSFSDFAMEVCRIPDNEADSHFRSQVRFLPQRCDKEFALDFIGKFENLTDDFKSICEKIGLPCITIGHHMASQDRDKDYRAYYTDRVCEFVGQRYSADVELFGYSFDKGSSYRTTNTFEGRTRSWAACAGRESAEK